MWCVLYHIGTLVCRFLTGKRKKKDVGAKKKVKKAKVEQPSESEEDDDEEDDEDDEVMKVSQWMSNVLLSGEG